ncbi:marine proteobacterial sortase target protein [Alcanivorax sp. 24]|uniref:marine proteobacterial sortase target protein n=1 Tax=Alcanivorax sp. 24 TaxID=2545266 RepID=UPI00105B3467|nr:marine proteobacterial sortase target protein [Alcanivorax sp. 24]
MTIRLLATRPGAAPRNTLPWALFCLAALLLSATAHALPRDTPAEPGSGVFLMFDDQGREVPATLLSSDVNIDISGPVAQITLVQSFQNEGALFSEGRYVFPLPEQAAVTGMTLTVGERRIVGEIQPKQEAKRRYQQARRDGHRAGLVEQRHSNLFTTSVAHIAPGERVEVTLHYSQTVDVRGNDFRLRVPMTLTPRYQPEGGESLSGPFQSPDSGASPNMARVQVELDAGQSILPPDSGSHDLDVSGARGVYQLHPSEGLVPMDRDFLLHWRIANAEQSRGSLFVETVNGEHYALVMLTPPSRPAATRALPRETLFIIDTSGSMSGASIRQARASLLEALAHLRPGDRFNVIEFNSVHHALFEAPMPADEAHLQQARRFVAGLEASGGTEMLPALNTALTMPTDTEYLRQVMFITDGAVTNEDGIFSLIHRRLGSARLFTVGIGSSPNSHFMRKAAQFGRGTFTYIGNLQEVSKTMTALFEKLENPVIRDVQLTLPPGVEAEIWPRRIPDLYASEPLLLTLKLNRVPEYLTLTGLTPTPWEQTLQLPEGRQHPGIARLWARNKIEALNDRLALGESEEVIRPLLTDVALEHSLMSRYTSFVAIERIPSRPLDEPLIREDLANTLPDGLAWPATATGVDRLWRHAAVLALTGLLLILVFRRRHRRD